MLHARFELGSLCYAGLTDSNPCLSGCKQYKTGLARACAPRWWVRKKKRQPVCPAVHPAGLESTSSENGELANWSLIRPQRPRRASRTRPPRLPRRGPQRHRWAGRTGQLCVGQCTLNLFYKGRCKSSHRH